MGLFDRGSISRKLVFVVVIAVLPALAILVYSGVEQRRYAAEKTRQELFLMTRSLVEAKRELANSTRQILATVALLPAVKSLDLPECEKIFRALLVNNPEYLNFALTDRDGWVIASAVPFSNVDFRDRKHVREAIATRAFAAGEYILTRIVTEAAAFAFAHPVFDEQGEVLGVLTSAISLSRSARYHSAMSMPDSSFLAVTDHNGIRLFYYPEKQDTNPIGQPVQSGIWRQVQGQKNPGTVVGQGSDGTRRLIAYEPVYFGSAATPYMYVWAGTLETRIFASADQMVLRNLILLLLMTGCSLMVALVIGRRTLADPIGQLVSLTQDLSAGRSIEDDADKIQTGGEIGELRRAFYSMAQRRRRVEDDLKLRTSELEQRNAELERFNYTVSHDLKTPLVTIETFAGFLHQDIKKGDDAAIARDIGYIRNATVRMAQLMDSLLLISRTGYVGRGKEEIIYNCLMEGLSALLAGPLTTRGVSLRCEPADLTLYADPSRLLEVWQNLAENAIKYMGDQNHPVIEIGVEKTGTDSVFYVRDNGIGIAPEYHSKIFDLFEQLDRKEEGNGLGLALVKRIVELYKGRIWVESAGPGRGSCFRFTLPEALNQE